MPTRLAREAKAAAAHRGKSLAAIVAEALASIVRQLGLPQIDVIGITGVSGGERRTAVHAASVELGGLRMLGRIVAFADEAILGRDLLNQAVVTLEGPRSHHLDRLPRIETSGWVHQRPRWRAAPAARTFVSLTHIARWSRAPGALRRWPCDHRAVLRRVYTNWLPIEEYEPEPPMEVTLELDGTRLHIEQRLGPSGYPEEEEDEGSDDEDEDKGSDGEDEDEGAEDAAEAASVAPPERRETVHPTADDARRAFDAEVARLLPRAGVDPPPGEDAELLWVGPGWSVGHEGWIRADACAVETAASDAAALRLGATDADDDVLADWQLGHADPHVRARGELSNLQRVRDPASRARAKELVAAHADAWLSGLLPIATIGFRRGFVDTVRLVPPAGGDDDDDTFRGAAMTERRELAAFLALPITSRLRRFVLGPVGPVAISGNPFIDNQPLLDALGGSALARLCDVELADGHLETLEPLWRLAVERVTTRCFIGRLGTIASASLRELRVLQGYGHADLPHLAQADCPRLEALEVRTRIHTRFRDEIVRFLGARFPALRHLTFAPTLPARDTLALVEREPLLRHLQTLTLGGAAFTAAAATALVAAAPRFAHLERLVIEGADTLAAEPAAALRRALPRIALSAAAPMTD